MKILILDWHNFIKRYSYLGQLHVIDKSEIIDNLCPKIINMFNKLITELSPDMIYVCSDSGVNKRARAIYGNYKANRLKAKTLTDEEKEIDNLNYLKEFIKTFPVGYIEIKNTEADMLIMCTVEYFRNKNENTEFIIASNDSDFYQLLDKNIKIYNWKEIVDTDNWNEKIKSTYHINATNYAMCKSIVGDNSDNINGLHGWGWSKVTKLFSHLENKFPDTKISNISILISHIEELINYEEDSKLKYFLIKCLEDIKNNRELIERNQHLIDLTMLETPYIFNIMNELNSILKSGFVFNKKEFINKLNIKRYKSDYIDDDFDYQNILKKNMKACYSFITFSKRTQRAINYFLKAGN